MGSSKYFFLLLLIFNFTFYTFSQTLIGQDFSRRTITTSVSFLNITPDSRAAGMGDVGVATSADEYSVYWNAAKLAFIEENNGLSLSYTPWLAKIVNDMFVVHLVGFYKIDSKQAVGISMKYFNVGKIFLNKGPTINDQLGHFNPREFTFSGTYSRILTPYLSIGGSLKYIFSNMIGNIMIGSGFDAKPGYSVAADVGVFFTKPSPSNKSILSFGLTVTNIGPKISYTNSSNASFIPTNLRLGGSYLRKLNDAHSLMFALDFNKLLVPSPNKNSNNKNLLEGIFESFGDAQGGFAEEMREITVSTGLEYWYNNVISGRIGYFWEADDKGDRKYLTFGIGAKIRKFKLDVAYMNPTNGREHALAETIRFSISHHFSGGKDEKKTTNKKQSSVQ